MKKDAFLTGFIPGIIVPFIGAFIFYLIFFREMEFAYFIKSITGSQKWVSVMSLGVLLNASVFFFFIRHSCDRSAQGVLGATFIYAFIVLYFRMF